MVSVTEYEEDFKCEITKIRGREDICCPFCGGRLLVHGTCIRKVQDEDGPHQYRLRVLQCRDCHKYHRELPDFIIPYKRTGLPGFCKIVEAEDDAPAYDESTLLRMRAWLTWFFSYARAVERSLLCTGRLHAAAEPGGRLAARMGYFVRMVANSGNWIHHRSALLVQT